MTELERRALLGDKQAQQECTEKGIVLPCAHGSECRIFRIEVDGKTAYRVISTHCCCFQGPARLTEKDALSDWNIRTAPPIGRCGDCKNSPDIGTKTKGMRWCRRFRGEVKQDGYCEGFKPKEREENAAD